ncbi:MAG: hypothetical protein WD603_00200 [Patescibacteria group bacterium]
MTTTDTVLPSSREVREQEEKDVHRDVVSIIGRGEFTRKFWRFYSLEIPTAVETDGEECKEWLERKLETLVELSDELSELIPGARSDVQRSALYCLYVVVEVMIEKTLETVVEFFFPDMPFAFVEQT